VRRTLSFPSKLSINLYHGRELTKTVEPFIKQEDEGKFRCKTCQKLFKATSFVEKHIANKHPELVKPLDDVSSFGLGFSATITNTSLHRSLTLITSPLIHTEFNPSRTHLNQLAILVKLPHPKLTAFRAHPHISVATIVVHLTAGADLSLRAILLLTTMVDNGTILRIKGGLQYLFQGFLHLPCAGTKRRLLDG
jgi:hypothetical protein